MSVSVQSALTRAALIAATGAGLVGCSDKGPLDWIDHDAAVVRCTSAGRDRSPPVLRGLPVPMVPSGMFVRAMDPMALDDLGYERDATVCATLLAPDTDELERQRQGVAALIGIRREASVAAKSKAGRCTCASAGELRPLIIGCVSRPTNSRCDPQNLRTEVQAELQPLVAQLGETSLPLIHWRMIGKFDRAGWFADKESELTARHPGGSTVFHREQPVGDRNNGPLIRTLLEVDDVVSVVRQDSGRALLVIREIGSQLVLDHFSYAAIGPDVGVLSTALDNARASEYIARLAKPTQTRALVHAPKTGSVVDIDVARISDVDDVVEIAATLVDADAVLPAAELPEPLISHASFQAPFGKQGAVLEAKLRLSARGRGWATLLSDELLTPRLPELNLEAEELEFDQPSELPFVGRTTQTERVLIYGLDQTPAAMANVEMNFPSTVKGRAAEWSFEMPLDNLVGVFGRDAAAGGLRDAFATTPYEITMALDDDRSSVVLRAAPR